MQVLFTDLIAVTLVLVVATGALIISARSHARLEKENRFLRNQAREMRKQIANRVEKPF